MHYSRKTSNMYMDILIVLKVCKTGIAPFNIMLFILIL